MLTDQQITTATIEQLERELDASVGSWNAESLVCPTS
jgi:hypothetical protein